MSMRNTCPFICSIRITVVSLNTLKRLDSCFVIILHVWKPILQKRSRGIKFSNTVLSSISPSCPVHTCSLNLIAVKIISVCIAFNNTISIFCNLFCTLSRCILFKCILPIAYIVCTSCFSIFTGHYTIRFLVI